MRYTVILLLMLLISNSCCMEYHESGYGSIPRVAQQNSAFWRYGKKSITCVRLILPMLLVCVPPLVGFITSSITCNSNNSQDSEHHQRIGQLLQELLNAARTNGTA